MANVMTRRDKAEWELAEIKNQRELAARLGANGLSTNQVEKRLAAIGAPVDERTVRRWMRPRKGSGGCRTTGGTSRKKRPVVREDGKRFESLSQASLLTYGSTGRGSGISRAIRTGWRAGGYHWRYANEEDE